MWCYQNKQCLQHGIGSKIWDWVEIVNIETLGGVATCYDSSKCDILKFACKTWDVETWHVDKIWLWNMCNLKHGIKLEPCFVWLASLIVLIGPQLFMMCTLERYVAHMKWETNDISVHDHFIWCKCSIALGQFMIINGTYFKFQVCTKYYKFEGMGNL
jgi:hypothetical protein